MYIPVSACNLLKEIEDFGGNARRKETTRKNRYKWGDNTKMDLRVIGWDGMGWIDLAQVTGQ
jgi:hypothetical protein